MTLLLDGPAGAARPPVVVPQGAVAVQGACPLGVQVAWLAHGGGGERSAGSTNGDMDRLLCGSEVCRWLASEGGDLQPYSSPGRPAPGSDFMVKLDPLFSEPSLASFPTTFFVSA